MNLSPVSEDMMDRILFTYGPGGFFAVISIAILVYFMRHGIATIKYLIERADKRDEQFLKALENNTEALNGFSEAAHTQNGTLTRLEREVREMMEATKHLPICVYHSSGYAPKHTPEEVIQLRKPPNNSGGKDIKVDIGVQPA